MLEKFETLPDAVEHIDKLAAQALLTPDKKKRKDLLHEAQQLADEYEAHCAKGGNYADQFKKFV